MSQTISARLEELGFNLPIAALSVGNYAPRLRIANMLYISGQLPVIDGTPKYIGKVHFIEERRVLSERRQHESAGDDQIERQKTPRRMNSSFVSGEDAFKAAEICALNILAQIAEEVGDDITMVGQIVRLGGFVNAGTDFTDHAKIVNGASNMMVNVFGKEVGTHVRAATGASSLPLDVPVEIEALIALI